MVADVHHRGPAGMPSLIELGTGPCGIFLVFLLCSIGLTVGGKFKSIVRCKLVEEVTAVNCLQYNIDVTISWNDQEATGVDLF